MSQSNAYRPPMGDSNGNQSTQTRRLILRGLVLFCLTILSSVVCQNLLLWFVDGSEAWKTPAGEVSQKMLVRILLATMALATLPALFICFFLRKTNHNVYLLAMGTGGLSCVIFSPSFVDLILGSYQL